MTAPSDDSGGPRARVVGVRKDYHLGGRSIAALRGVDLLVDEPGCYAIMGPSGSGKSTLLHLLAGLDRPDAGTIEVMGARVDSMDERALTTYRRRMIGLVFQAFNLVSTLTAVDNVALPALLDGMPVRERRGRALALLDELGTADRAEHRPDALSGGEQQRVAIARALLFQPEVLFADEPTGNLDTATSDAFWGRLEAIASRRSLTVIMVTHEPEAVTHCRRAFILRDGLIADQFDTEGRSAADLASRAQRSRG